VARPWSAATSRAAAAAAAAAAVVYMCTTNTHSRDAVSRAFTPERGDKSSDDTGFEHRHWVPGWVGWGAVVAGLTLVLPVMSTRYPSRRHNLDICDVTTSFSVGARPVRRVCE